MKTRSPEIQDLTVPLTAPHFVPNQFRTAVDAIVREKTTIAQAEKALDERRIPIERDAERFRADLERGGVFTKTLFVEGTTQNVALTYADAYAPLDVAVEQDLKILLGSHYEALFERKTEVKVKDPVRFLRALDAEGDSDIGPLLRDLVTITEYVAVKPDFRERRFQLRAQLSWAQNEALDKLVVQIANRPALTVK